MKAGEIALDKRLILAPDTPDVEAAHDLVKRTRGFVGTFKVGLELFTAGGPRAVERVRAEGADVFLDLKLHDIPNTVAGAVREVARLGVSLLTVHALGGAKMMAAAVEALSSQTSVPGHAPTRIIAVTVLTSMTGDDVRSIGLGGTAAEAAGKLASIARDAGVHGVVCSPEEARVVRQIGGPGFLVVCPGIRPKDAPLGDQARTATPLQAVQDGADYLVVGRPIRTAPDPGKVASEILAEIERGLAGRR